MTKDEKFAMLFGIMLGDGWISKRTLQGKTKSYIAYNGGFSGDEESLHVVRRDLTDIFGDIGKATITTKETISDEYGIVGTTSSFVVKTDVSLAFIAKGMPTGRKVEQKVLIPDWIMNGADKIKSAFLSGYYAAEGDNLAFQSKNDRTLKAPSFVIYKRSFLEKEFKEEYLQFQQLLSDIGIVSNIKLSRRYTCAENIVCEIVLSNSLDNIIAFTDKLDMRYCQYKAKEFSMVRAYYMRRKKLHDKLTEGITFAREHPEIRTVDIARKYGVCWATADNWRKRPQKQAFGPRDITYSQFKQAILSDQNSAKQGKDLAC